MNYSMMTYTMSRYPDFDIRKTIEFAAELQMKGTDICFGENMKVLFSDIRSLK